MSPGARTDRRGAPSSPRPAPPTGDGSAASASTTLVIAEKPSVARDLARVLGVHERGEGCLRGRGYVITWALGHLVHFAEPDAYKGGWDGRWSLSQLPMVPEQWRLHTERSTAAQLRVVEGLLNAPDTTAIVVATDAGREGELIFRLIYEHARCRRPFRRLWISSLTDQAIAEGFARLQPGEAFDDLAAAARARAQADWLVGMNLTRAYTVRQGVLCTIGRVQTPTLAMLVAREAEIAAFRVATYYELLARFAAGFAARYRRDGQTRLDDRQAAEALLQRLAPVKQALVESVEQSVRRQHPPPFYSLVDLQRDANRRLGMTAAQALQQAQALYESAKLITYPRTESRHLPEDMEAELPGILARLAHPHAAAARQRLATGHRLGRSHVDRTRLTDHHAIVPTGAAVPATLPLPQRRLYELVESRFVAAFLPDEVTEQTQVVVRLGGEEFFAKGERVLEAGWTVAAPRRAERPTRRDPRAAEATDDEPEDDSQTLPSLAVGQVLQVDGLELVEKQTQPPRRYTDATLLAAMKNAGRQVDDEGLAEAMRQSGLGTPATRAEIIERLIRSELVERQRKALVPTAKGQALVGVVADPLRRPELTAQWEQRLRDVEEGRLAASAFYASIVQFVRELVPQAAASAVMAPAARAAAQSGGRRRDGKTRSGARGRPTPRAAVPPTGDGDTSAAPGSGAARRRSRSAVAGARARGPGPAAEDDRGVAAEAPEGVTPARGGPRRRRAAQPARSATAGGPAAGLRAGPPTDRSGPGSAAVGSDPPAAHGPLGLTCPRCRQGRILEGRRGFGCSRYREGCLFVVWKEKAGRQLSPDQVRDLIVTGSTRLLTGFVDEWGQTFAARVVLGPGAVVGLERPPSAGPGPAGPGSPAGSNGPDHP